MFKKWWALGLSAIYLSTIHAQQADNAAERPLIIYKVQAGDTLSQLSARFFVETANLEVIRSLNHLRHIDLLPSGKHLKIPREFVKQSPSQATIISISCARMIRAGSPPKALSVGAVLSEGTIIDVPAECQVSMLLEDSSVIRLPSSAAVKFSVLRKNALESSPQVELELVRGRIELDVNKNRSRTTPFDVRTPLSVTGVRGTEFRVGYAPTEQVGQVEVVRGIVAATGISDSQSQPVSKGQGLPFDRSGKAMTIENLLDAPVFERAEATHATPPTHAIKLAPNPSAKHYVVLNTKSANLLGEQTSQTITTAEVLATNLSQDAVFYQFASVSPSGLIGPSRQYGFCSVTGDIKFGRCRARFDAPLADGALITFSLIKHALGTTQELVSTQKLQARNGRFVIEGLPAGHYTWNMSYLTSSPGNTNHESTLTKQSGYFDLIALKTNLP